MMLFPSELDVNVLRRVWAAPIERAEMIRRWLHEGGRFLPDLKAKSARRLSTQIKIRAACVHSDSYRISH